MLFSKTNKQRPDDHVSYFQKQRFGRTTKFKHFKGTTMAKSEMFENLKNLSKSMASECDLIKANVDRVAIPLAGDDMPFDISKNLC